MRGALQLMLVLGAALGAAFTAGPGGFGWTGGDRTAAGSSAAAPLAGWHVAPAAAIDDALSRDVPVLVYARTASPICKGLEAAMGADALTTEALAGYALLALDVNGQGEGAARRLGLRVAPLFAAVEADALRACLDGAAGAADVLTPLRSVTGGTHEPFGLTAELLRLLDHGPDGDPAATPEGAAEVLGRVEHLEALGRFDEALEVFTAGLAAEPRVTSRLHGMARLRTAVLSHTVEGPADGEGTIEAALMIEADREVLFRGWSMLASSFASKVRAAEASEDGTYDGVDARRWRRRMREATRKAWVGCPDDRVVPYASLLISRYGEDPEDLDSLDRAFAKAVLRALKKADTDGRRAAEAEATVGTLKRK